MDYGGYDDYNNQAYYDYNPNDEYSVNRSIIQKSV